MPEIAHGLRAALRRLLWPLLGLGALLAFNFFASPGFFSLEIRDGRLFGPSIDILNRGSQVMLLALGMTLVIATGGVDLSVGSVMAIAGGLAALLLLKSGVPFPLAVAAALGVCALGGAFNGVMVAWIGIQPIVATLILMVLGRGVAMAMTGGHILTFEHPAFVYLGNGHWLGLPFTLTIVLAAFLLTSLLTRATAFGLFIEAVGDNATASRFCGVEARAVKLAVYTFSGLLAGVAGLIATSNIKAADSARIGEMMELDAIFAVVVGGTALTGGRFTLAGSIIGALLIQTLTTTMYRVGVPPAISPVPKALVILLVCLLQSETFRARATSLWQGRRA